MQSPCNISALHPWETEPADFAAAAAAAAGAHVPFAASAVDKQVVAGTLVGLRGQLPWD